MNIFLYKWPEVTSLMPMFSDCCSNCRSHIKTFSSIWQIFMYLKIHNVIHLNIFFSRCASATLVISQLPWFQDVSNSLVTVLSISYLKCGFHDRIHYFSYGLINSEKNYTVTSHVLDNTVNLVQYYICFWWSHQFTDSCRIYWQLYFVTWNNAKGCLFHSVPV